MHLCCSWNHPLHLHISQTRRSSRSTVWDEWKEMKRTNASLISSRKEDEDHLFTPWWGGSKMDCRRRRTGSTLEGIPAATARRWQQLVCARRYPGGGSTAAAAAGPGRVAGFERTDGRREGEWRGGFEEFVLARGW
jgi:hypothetical protein